jgi:hypothetical protein
VLSPGEHSIIGRGAHHSSDRAWLRLFDGNAAFNTRGLTMHMRRTAIHLCVGFFAIAAFTPNTWAQGSGSAKLDPLSASEARRASGWSRPDG